MDNNTAKNLLLVLAALGLFVVGFALGQQYEYNQWQNEAFRMEIRRDRNGVEVRRTKTYTLWPFFHYEDCR